MLNLKDKMRFRVSLLLVNLVFLFGLVTVVAVNAQNNPNRLNYIEKYKDIAISEMERAGIPASIKLAQGILESNSGKSVLARKANNHFGMKCGSQWKGKTYYREDDDYDDQGNLLESCFRVYKDADASYIAHSEFLRDPRKDYRYGFLFRLDVKDYKRWALGLKKAGYATNPRYPDLLIGLIEDYELYVYDNMDVNETAFTPPDLPIASSGNIILINNIRTALAAEGETVLDVANRAQVPINRLLRYNEDLKKGSQLLDKDYRVFLQPKRGSFQGKTKYHYVKSGETMMEISQKYGIKLAKLYSKNRLPEGKEAAIGSKIKLRGWKVPKTAAPKVRKKGEDTSEPATIPVQDMDQDKEMDFDVSVPSTSVDDFERPKPDTGNATGTKPPSTNPTKPSPKPTTTNPSPPKTQPSTPSPPKTQPSAPSNTSASYYTVQAGDTLYRLSKRFETTVPLLKEWNGLSSNVISVGQRLKVRK